MEECNLGQNLEVDMVQEVLKSGTDLRQYSRQVEKKLNEVENKSIQDYIKESENIASLHNQISACDSILERMESMLLSFQSDLGSISSEILFLQRKSVAMSQQLHNRQAVRAPLSQFIDDVAVSEALVRGILDGPVSEKEFMTLLETLNQKIFFVKEQCSKDAKPAQDVRDVLEKLKLKAVAKIRAHLLEQIYKFRKPMTNYQVPQNAMLKNKLLFKFLLSHEQSVAQEVCAEYVDTTAKIYYSYFKSYLSRLAKLRYEETPGKDDLMGIEDTGGSGGGRGGGLLFYSKASSLRNRGTVFTIGDRGVVLESQLEAPIIVPHTALNKYPYEALFRSAQYAVVDNACREYLFIVEFFTFREDAALELFDQIMGKTLNLMVKNLETFVQDTYDAIAIFLCSHLVSRYQMTCHKRAVPALDRYWDTLQAIIWPRFEYIFRLNINSIQDCDPLKFSRELGPHYITRRYAEFSAAIVGLSETFPNELVNRLLAELQEQVECFLLRMAAIFPQREEQLIFLINNYDLVLQVLVERKGDNSKEAESFRGLLGLRSSEYVEEILSPHFGGIMQFVKEGEILLEKGQGEELKKQERKSLSLVQSFSNTWKKSLEQLSQKVLKSFPNFVTGSSLLQLALTQLVQYYHRFQKLLTPNARAQLTNIHHIMVEIKKYKTGF